MGALHEKQLLEVVAYLCHFIRHEVIHPEGMFFQKDHKLAMDPKFISLHDWANQQHRAASSSVGKWKKSMYSSSSFNDVL
jgi:hypothetical protein